MTFVEFHTLKREKEIHPFMCWDEIKQIVDKDEDEFLFAAKCANCGREGRLCETERGAALLAWDAGWLLLNHNFTGSDFTYHGEAFCPRCCHDWE